MPPDCRHVAAIRIYSTAAFKVLNGPLREVGRTAPHPLPVTVSFIADGVKKLRTVQAEHLDGVSKEERKERLLLFRGMKDRQVPDEFFESGGTELGCLSTTTDMSIALAFSMSQHTLIFRLAPTSFMGLGTPPVTCLRLRIIWCGSRNRQPCLHRC